MTSSHDPNIDFDKCLENAYAAKKRISGAFPGENRLSQGKRSSAGSRVRRGPSGARNRAENLVGRTSLDRRLESTEVGLIFDITKYMIEDGPGIRTVVFFQGCPLRCLWCSNPLGQSACARLVYLKHKCIGCRACVHSCIHRALFLDAKGRIARNPDRCTQCGSCAAACPVGARELYGAFFTVDEVLAKVEKDRIFYRRSGGGLTLSGGEILMQAPFAAHLLRAARERLLHTAIETCALGNWEDLLSVLVHADLAFIDVKHFDPSVHKRLTGHTNYRILKNIRKAAAFCLESGKALILRLAVVPGINDGTDNLTKIAHFLRSLPGGWELNLLPYHRYGVHKYEWLGLEYPLGDVKLPGRERLKEIAGFFESLNIPCSVGGGEIRTHAVGSKGL